MVLNGQQAFQPFCWFLYFRQVHSASSSSTMSQGSSTGQTPILQSMPANVGHPPPAF
jgi:hypothetical protein